MPTLYPVVKDLTSINHSGWGNTKEWIIIHFVGAAGQAKDNANYFRNVYREASAHYFVDPNNIIQVVEDGQVAWHVGDGYSSGKGTYNGYIGYGATNNNAIGIEMCQDTSTGKDAWEWQIHQKTYEQTLLLTVHLMRKYNIPFDHVIRHYDVSGKLCPGCWLDNGKWTMWWKFKSDLKQLLNGGNITEAQATVEKQRYSDKTIIWENWTGYVAVDALNVRNSPSTDGAPVAQYSRGDEIHFDGWLWANGYRWGTYKSYSGIRRYVAYNTIEGEAQPYMTW